MSSTELTAAQHFRVSGRTEYLTPKSIIDALGPFDTDPCASDPRPWPTARRHYTKTDNGLAQTWDGLCWCNFPFGRVANGCDCNKDGKRCLCHIGKVSPVPCVCEFPGRPEAAEIDWYRKLVAHPGGGIALGSPGKTETVMWQQVVFPACSGILFLAKRLSFCNVDGTALAGTFGPSVLIAFGMEGARRLERCGLAGYRMKVIRFGM